MSHSSPRPPFSSTGTGSVSRSGTSPSASSKEFQANTNCKSPRGQSSQMAGTGEASGGKEVSGSDRARGTKQKPLSAAKPKVKFPDDVAAKANEQSASLAPGPPPEAGCPGNNRRSNRQPSRMNNGMQVMRVPSLRGPSGFGNQPSSAQFGSFRGGGRARGSGHIGNLPSFTTQFVPPPPFGVQSYQHWATRPNYGPRSYPCPPSVIQGFAAARDGPPTRPSPPQAWSTPFPPPPPIDPLVSQSMYWIRNLVPAALGYLEANPDVDQALGLVVHRVCQGMLGPQQQQPPPPPPPPNARGYGRPGPAKRGRGPPPPSAPPGPSPSAKNGSAGLSKSQPNLAEPPGSTLPTSTPYGGNFPRESKKKSPIPRDFEESWSEVKPDLGSPGPSNAAAPESTAEAPNPAEEKVNSS